MRWRRAAAKGVGQAVVELPAGAASVLAHVGAVGAHGRVVAVAAGACHGVIAEHGRGREGFGYDPLFVVSEHWRTFGEITPAVKAVISHRARALRAILPAIVHAIRGPEGTAGVAPPKSVVR